MPDAQAVTDAGLAHLAGLTMIERLELPGTVITGKCLATFGPHPKLKMLSLAYSSFDDEGCRFLSEAFPELEWLRLNNAQITDVGIASLAKLSKLRELDVSYNPRVTDLGLSHLGQLKNLHSIAAAGTHITRQAAAEMHAATGMNFSPPHSSDIKLIGDSYDWLIDKAELDGKTPDAQTPVPKTPHTERSGVPIGN